MNICNSAYKSKFYYITCIVFALMIPCSHGIILFVQIFCHAQIGLYMHFSQSKWIS